MVLSFDFKDSLNGIACGRRDSLGLKAATVFRTSNGGVNWTREYFTSHTEFKKVKYINNNLLYIYGSVTPTTFDVFGKSTDNGNTWTFTNQTPPSLYESIQILNENYAWKFRRTGQIYKSTDGCLSWTREDSTAVMLWSSSFTSITNGWAVGNPGAIFHYTNTTYVTKESETADNFKLEQNYPNPFNPATTIKFHIKENGYVTLIIYNLLGKEVEILVNGNKNRGSYTVKWNAENVPGGVYFCKLTSGNKKEIKKLILLK